ncbi:hypothetical protein TPHV1_150012 [Treponema phagedenis]|uniref:Uncharacterized protein n=1 Tax=Treponema phagedenis TaxID=162 RepID=A0A0B7GVZ2_TREPH|nr:hypothetical protein TPHV1_150012 [Treponema phagedenis]
MQSFKTRWQSGGKLLTLCPMVSLLTVVKLRTATDGGCSKQN